MTTLSKEVRAALGLNEGTRLDRQDRFASPRSPEGRGLSSASPLDTIVDEFLKAPHVAESIGGASGAPGSLRRWAREPGIFLLELTGLTATRTGGPSVFLSDEELVVDARGEAGFVRLTGPQVDVVWHLTSDAAELLTVEAGAPSGFASAVERLSRIEPQEPVALTSPTALEITGGVPPAPWLAAAHDALVGSPSLLDRAAAAGLLARFHSPRLATHLTVEELLELPSPVRAAQAWRAALPRETQDALVTLAITRTGELRETFQEVRTAIMTGVPEARRLARHWVDQRDLLESVRMLFGREAPELKAALERLDDDIAVHHSIWNMIDAWDDDPALSELSWRDPDAWWGHLSGI